MNEAVICKSSPVKTLAVSAAPLKELLNFLIYGRHGEILTERARRQPNLLLREIPANAQELKDLLKAERLDKNGKLFFDCSKSENQIAVLLDNHGAQFWVHYFRCGIGLVNLSFFNHLSSAEGSLKNHARSVMHGGEYQWFTHELPAEFFGSEFDETTIELLGDYFVEKVNPALSIRIRFTLRIPKSKSRINSFSAVSNG